MNDVLIYRNNDFQYNNTLVDMDECLNSVKIFLNERYNYGIISYNLFKNNITGMILSIEITDSNDRPHKYDIPLRIDDKKS